MFERLKKLFLSDKIDENGLDSAVKKGWITEEQKEEILNSK